MRPLRVLLLSDGRPGHYHLAEGVIAALARFRNVEIQRRDVRRRILAPNRMLAALVARRVAWARLLKFGYDLPTTALPEADLVVSAGGNTLAANIAAANLLGADNIFYGSVRQFAPEDFSLVLTSHPRRAALPRHIMTLKPVATDPDALQGASDPQSVVATPCRGLLIGGQTATIRYLSDDWDNLERFVRAQAQRGGTRWIVANSPRTPRQVTARFLRLAAEAPALVEMIDFERAGPGTLNTLFARASAVLATVDSSSMVSEAVWMRKPTLVIAPEMARLPADEREYRDYLAANRWAAELKIRDLSAERAEAMLASVKTLVANPLDLLAVKVRDALPQLDPGDG